MKIITMEIHIEMNMMMMNGKIHVFSFIGLKKIKNEK